MRVLFAAHGAYGHLLPLLPTAFAMRRAGHEVVIATGADACPVVGALGLPAVPAGLSNREMVDEASRRWPQLVREPPARWATRMFTDIAAPVMAARLMDLVTSWEPDLVVREEGEYGAPLAAARAAIPLVTHAWGSPLPSRADLDAVAVNLGPLWQREGLAAPKVETLYGAALLHPCPPSLDGEDRPAVAEHRVRPVLLEMRAVDASWIPPSGALVYVGFGTVPLYRDQPELLTMAVQGVLAAGVSAVVTTPDRGLARRLRALGDGRVETTDWVSLSRLLPSCLLVVGHGGAGTTLAALANAVPLLLLPGGSPSQLRMSRACAARGVARVVDPSEVQLQDLIAAVAEALAADRMRAAAAEVAVEIAGMPGPEEAASLLLEYAR
jgi:UDP:flavonoid glycosyltransferase YjiC (YdhE family)